MWCGAQDNRSAISDKGFNVHTSIRLLQTEANTHGNLIGEASVLYSLYSCCIHICGMLKREQVTKQVLVHETDVFY